MSFNSIPEQDAIFLENIDIKQRNDVLEQTVSKLMRERESLLHEINLYKTLNHESQVTAAILKEEVVALSLSKLEIQQNGSPRNNVDLQEYKKEVSMQISKFKAVLEDLQGKNSNLSQKIVTFGSQIVKMDRVQMDGVKKLKKDFEEKIKRLICEHRCVVCEVIKKYAIKTKAHESTINQLQEEVLRKESEVKMCQIMLRDMKSQTEKEVNQAKSEMEAAAQKSEAELKEKLIETEKQLAKISKWNKRLIKDYESRLLSIRRDKEIQVQALQMQLNDQAQTLNGQKVQEVENTINTLESRYQTIISNMNEVNKKQRQSDLQKINELESKLETQNQRN